MAVGSHLSGVTSGFAPRCVGVYDLYCDLPGMYVALGWRFSREARNYPMTRRDNMFCDIPDLEIDRSHDATSGVYESPTGFATKLCSNDDIFQVVKPFKLL